MVERDWEHTSCSYRRGWCLTLLVRHTLFSAVLFIPPQNTNATPSRGAVHFSTASGTVRNNPGRASWWRWWWWWCCCWVHADCSNTPAAAAAPTAPHSSIHTEPQVRVSPVSCVSAGCCVERMSWCIDMLLHCCMQKHCSQSGGNVTFKHMLLDQCWSLRCGLRLLVLKDTGQASC